ncbi:hypothetical protein JHK82_023120 [Glycine max]|uniref:Uncharacterized protein n=2 Tax=Glycine subgen. Soja TaxID=1462606 RepID=K7LA36_SOYBN|nr:hypothetical protein JHK87_023042 [Glycine soja]KAG5017506.1 hypothetical protein JHK85_023642 [Glycine max]KAG5027253.1 hypothetical protein JHK86_023167 [Glycine max]KAG5138389.1 hypothetical protein JHK82_023120 [Glycine max]KAH1054047.1 hypothetical protein GYH30_023025 [Glycine max]
MALFRVLPCLSDGLVLYFVPIVVFMVFARFNGKIVVKNLKSGYDCEWKKDSLGANLLCFGCSHHVVVCASYG